MRSQMRKMGYPSLQTCFPDTPANDARLRTSLMGGSRTSPTEITLDARLPEMASGTTARELFPILSLSMFHAVVGSRSLSRAPSREPFRCEYVIEAGDPAFAKRACDREARCYFWLRSS